MNSPEANNSEESKPKKSGAEKSKPKKRKLKKSKSKKSEKQWTADRVKALRLKLNATQKEFAEMLGVHVVTIIRWEKDNFNPSKMALKLLDVIEKTSK